MKETKKIWHYTIGNYLPSILRGGLKPATEFLPKGEKPAVWFSTAEDWEETANKSYMKDGNRHNGDKKITKHLGGGLIRIQVSPKIANIPWDRFVAMKHIKKKFAKGLVESAKEQGANPKEWRVSLKRVKTADFLAVEYHTDVGWIDISDVLKPDFLETIDTDISGVDLINKVTID